MDYLNTNESQRLRCVSEALPAKVQLHSGCDSLWAVFHALETKIDREVASTGLAVEDLNVAVVVVANPVLHNSWRPAVETSMNIKRLNHSRLDDLS